MPLEVSRNCVATALSALIAFDCSDALPGVPDSDVRADPNAASVFASDVPVVELLELAVLP